MGRRDVWQGRVGVAGAVLFALVVLGAGLCLFDHNDDGLDGHGMPQDLCCVMLVVPAVTLTLSRLVPRGLVVTLTRAELIAVPLSVLDPPPRRSLLA